MKQLRMLGIVFFSLLSLISYAESTHEYRQEFESFKNSPRYEAIFNEDAPITMSNLQANIENDTQLSVFQRFVRSAFFSLQPVVITAKTMPKIYTYVDNICKEQHIETPTIFITRDITWKLGFFSAGAQKLLMSSGAIVIGQKLLLETTDAELEAVVAHELGHIKYNHINKDILITILSMIGTNIAVHKLLESDYDTIETFVAKTYLADFIGLCISRLIVNKRFEKQADEFAYKTIGKTNGSLELFNDLKNREEKYDNYFGQTYNLLQKNRNDLGLLDNMSLTIKYYLASFGHEIGNLYKWLYYNTPVGAHPSPEARLKAVQDYLDSQKAQMA